MKMNEIITEASKPSRKVTKIKRRNFVAVHAQTTGSGEHKPKRGEKASRVRQKREWKREISEACS